MYAYELLPRLMFLALTGYEDGEYEWCGTGSSWKKVEEMEKKLTENHE